MTSPFKALFWFVLAVHPLAAQANRPFVEFGVGTLSPTDNFSVALALRGGAGMVFGGQNAVTLDYLRQSTHGSDLGTYARQFLGVEWQHAFRDAFTDQEPMRLQYLTRLGGGTIIRGTFPEAVGDEELRDAPFLDFGLVIRYPVSSRIGAVATIEDAVAFLPAQTVRSYCSTQNGYPVCYPRGGPDYYTIDLPAKTQHNLGVVMTMQLRL